MAKYILIFLCCCMGAFVAKAQKGVSDPVTWYGLDTIKAPSVYDHVHVVRLNGDTLVTSFLIFIKDEVKLHYHDDHSEHVYVLDGTGKMTMGKRIFNVKKGDFIFIPKQTTHSVVVTSPKPMKVISIQAPWFDGKDRFLVK